MEHLRNTSDSTQKKRKKGFALHGVKLLGSFKSKKDKSKPNLETTPEAGTTVSPPTVNGSLETEDGSKPVVVPGADVAYEVNKPPVNGADDHTIETTDKIGLSVGGTSEISGPSVNVDVPTADADVHVNDSAEMPTADVKVNGDVSLNGDASESTLPDVEVSSETPGVMITGDVSGQLNHKPEIDSSEVEVEVPSGDIDVKINEDVSPVVNGKATPKVNGEVTPEVNGANVLNIDVNDNLTDSKILPKPDVDVPEVNVAVSPSQINGEIDAINPEAKVEIDSQVPSVDISSEQPTLDTGVDIAKDTDINVQLKDDEKPEVPSVTINNQDSSGNLDTSLNVKGNLQTNANLPSTTTSAPEQSITVEHDKPSMPSVEISASSPGMDLPEDAEGSKQSISVEAGGSPQVPSKNKVIIILFSCYCQVIISYAITVKDSETRILASDLGLGWSCIFGR